MFLLFLKRAIMGAGLLLMAGCSVPNGAVAPGEVFDPYEERNRKVHAFNISVDKRVLRSSGKGYSKAVPEDLQKSIGNFADNLALPGMMVNNLLQGDLKGAVQNTYRFVVNSTLGFGGLFDVSGEFGVAEASTDFGETLHVWGVPEGAYVELPLIGPSTERATAGRVVDLFTNPLSYVLPSPEKYYGTAATLAAKVGDRGRYGDTLDAILYDSADSYAQSRTIYLQNRRFKLGGDEADAYVDPYDDVYEDPYAE